MPSRHDSNGIYSDQDVRVVPDQMLPTEIQSRLSQTIQTHNAVSIALSSSSTQATWMDLTGFSTISITMANDGTTSSSAQIYWSHDNTNQHGMENIITGSTNRYQSGSTPVKARYAKFVLYNNDAGGAHTMSAWAYLTT